jgi:hypothetical protein
MLNNHDHYHDHDYRNWAEKAKVNGWEELRALLDEAAVRSWQSQKGISLSFNRR